jgi:hypothetical protein
MGSREITQAYKPHPSCKKLRYMQRMENGEKSYGYCEWDGMFHPIPTQGKRALDKETGLVVDISIEEAMNLFQ